MVDFSSLVRYPLVQAPMAGGGSRPELAAAVSTAGGLGFLAAGYKSTAAMAAEIDQLRAWTSRPFGVNLFVPQHPPAAVRTSPPPAGPAADIGRYRQRLAPEAARYQAALGDPDAGADDEYQAKLEVLTTGPEPVPVVSFTFGCPQPETIAALRAVGSSTVVTVTSADEARSAERAGADAVCVQGIEAGGHQGTHRDEPSLDGSGMGLLTLLAVVREAVRLPLIAAGGVMRGAQIAAALAAGADAAQLGTAFLVCPESGAAELHKAALTDDRFPRTALTRAFSGRPARGLVNRFIRAYDEHAPAAYPQVHHLTSPVRRAAAAAGDPQAMALWAGQGHRLARALPAAELVEVLMTELDEARKASPRLTAAQRGGHGGAFTRRGGDS